MYKICHLYTYICCESEKLKKKLFSLPIYTFFKFALLQKLKFHNNCLTKVKFWERSTFIKVIVFLNTPAGHCKEQRNFIKQVFPHPVSPMTITGMLHL